MKNIFTPEIPNEISSAEFQTIDPNLVDINKSTEAPVPQNEVIQKPNSPKPDTEPRTPQSTDDNSHEVPVHEFANEHDRVNLRPNKRHLARMAGAVGVAAAIFAGGMMARGSGESSAARSDTKQSTVEVPANITPTSIESPVVVPQTTTAPETVKPAETAASPEYLPGMDKGLNVVYTMNDGHERTLPKIVGYSKEVIASERERTEATVMFEQWLDLFTGYLTTGNENLLSAMTNNLDVISPAAAQTVAQMKVIGPQNWDYRFQNVFAEGSGEANFSPGSTVDKKIILLKGVIIDDRSGVGKYGEKVLPEIDTKYRHTFNDASYTFLLQPDGSYKLDSVAGSETTITERLNEDAVPVTNG